MILDAPPFHIPPPLNPPIILPQTKLLLKIPTKILIIHRPNLILRLPFPPLPSIIHTILPISIHYPIPIRQTPPKPPSVL